LAIRNNNFLTHIRKTEQVIEKAMKHYDQTGELPSLKIAMDGHIQILEILAAMDIEESHEHGHYGHDFELTK
jgi:DNA-binding FadR family transcriptional regulator